MAQRKPRRRSGAKIATKKEQAELLQRARALAEDPSPLVPEATGATKRIADRLERRLKKISESRDNERRLKGFMKRGPELARGYANLLLVAASEKAGRMASTETPVGSLKYAIRGMVPREAVVAVQHYRYPQVRILAYRDLVRKTHGVAWATPEGVALTGRKDPPPRSWLTVLQENVPVSLERNPDDPELLHCPHLKGEAAGRDRLPLALEVELAAGPTRFQVCRHCVEEHLQKRDNSLFTNLVALVVGLKPRHITARVTGTPKTCIHDGDCAWSRHVPAIHEGAMNAYREGRRSEAELLTKHLPRWEDQIREARERLLVAGEECYGTDEERLLDATGETGDRRQTLQRFLELGPPVVIAKDTTMNHILEALWEVAPKVLKELHPYPDELEGLLKKHAKSPPAAVVDEVLEARRSLAVLKGYPRYDRLPPAARAGDRIARAHRTGSDTGIAGAVEKELALKDPHKGVLWAALRIIKQEETHRWRFDKISIEAGEFLEEPLKKLMEADADDYHDRLAQLHTLAGGQGEVPPPSGTV